MTIILNLKSEVEADLVAYARSVGITPEEYLNRLVEREFGIERTQAQGTDESGMVWADGLLIYGAGTILPRGFLDGAIRGSREERSQHILRSRP